MTFSKKNFFQILIILLLSIKVSETTNDIYKSVYQEVKITFVDFDDTEKEENEEKEVEENYKISHQSCAVISNEITFYSKVKKAESSNYNSIFQEFTTPPPKLIFT